MHHEMIMTLTVGLAAALVLGFITQKLKLSPIVGYLLAGLALGPYTPSFVAHQDSAKQFAEMGVILLMFGVGLHFHLKELLAVKRVALPGAIAQSTVATGLGYLAAKAMGWSGSAGLVFGLAISVASTVVLLRVLADANDLHTPSGHIAVGWLVVEDIFTVLVLVLLPVLYPRDAVAENAPNIWGALGVSSLKIAAFVLLMFWVGGKVIPALLSRIAATRSRELFTLTVLVLALGIAVSASQLFGVSMELGAFLAGMIVGQSDFSSRAASEALPMRDAFAVLFFVSVGMHFNPSFLLEQPKLVAVTLAIILIGKPLAALFIVLLLKYPLRTALSVAVVLSQIGEFSFIVAALGFNLGILPPEAQQALIAASIISISLNPLVYRLVDPLDKVAQHVPILSQFTRPKVVLPSVAGETPEKLAADVDRAIVVGYGPVGRTLVELLQENDIEPTVIELNLDTVRRLRAQGIRAIYGDYSHEQTIKEAGVEKAVAFIISSSGASGSDEVIRRVHALNPKIQVMVRTTYLREADALRRAGADVVFSGEGEVALTMTEFLLRRLGATPEQIDRERDRIRREFDGRPPLLTPA